MLRGVIIERKRRREKRHENGRAESRISYLLVGIGVGAIGGLIAALLARKETRDLLCERSAKSLEYLNQQGNKLREASEGFVGKGKAMLSSKVLLVTSHCGKRNVGSRGSKAGALGRTGIAIVADRCFPCSIPRWSRGEIY
jgi:hypothetical protein